MGRRKHNQTDGEAILDAMPAEDRAAVETAFEKRRQTEVSERNRATAAKQKAGGFVYSGRPAVGFKRVQRRGGKVDIPDAKARRIMGRIVELHDDDGLTFKAIAQWVYDAECKRVGRKKGSATFNGWTLHRARELYLREKRLQEQGL